MDKVELVLAQLHAASVVLEDVDEAQDELISELKAVMQEATVCAYRLRLGASFGKLARAS